MSTATLRRLERLGKLANPDFSDDWASHCEEIARATPLFRRLGLPDIADRMERSAASPMPKDWRPDTRSYDEMAAEVRRKLGME